MRPTEQDSELRRESDRRHVWRSYLRPPGNRPAQSISCRPAHCYAWPIDPFCGSPLVAYGSWLSVFPKISHDGKRTVTLILSISLSNLLDFWPTLQFPLIRYYALAFLQLHLPALFCSRTRCLCFCSLFTCRVETRLFRSWISTTLFENPILFLYSLLLCCLPFPQQSWLSHFELLSSSVECLFVAD